MSRVFLSDLEMANGSRIRGLLAPINPDEPARKQDIDELAVGAQGPQGDVGAQGAAGADSTVAGPQGAIGPQGAQGEDGDDSIVPGPQGPQGPVGEGVGPQGPQGATGADSTVPGPQGNVGPQGVAGAQGDVGAQGAQGDTGGNAGKVFYLDPSVLSDIPGHQLAAVSPSAAPESSVVASPTSAADVLVGVFATELGVPGALDFPAGTSYRRFYALTSSNSHVARIKTEVYICEEDGSSETLIKSGYTDNFSGTVVQPVVTNYTDSVAYVLTKTQRLLFKIYASRVSGTSSIDVTVFFNGNQHNSQIQTTLTTGHQGPQGDVGAAGPQGAAGADGAQGADGAAGPQGPVGEGVGPQGPQGADSTVPGPQGAVGAQGDVGPQGSSGADSTVPGPQGAEGAQGPQGVTPAPTNVKRIVTFTLDTVETNLVDINTTDEVIMAGWGFRPCVIPLPSTCPGATLVVTNQVGSACSIVMVDGGNWILANENPVKWMYMTGYSSMTLISDGTWWYFDSCVPNQPTQPVDPVPGPQGDVGPQGPQGDAGADSVVPGPQGPQGDVGAQGSTGAQGSNGADSTVPGPQGTAGAQGANGAQGAAGPQGLTGTAGGTGPQGDAGAAGAQGSTGGTGPQGPAGVQGANGSTGGTGPQGDAGAAGAQGAAGGTGPQGAAGPQGLTGTAGGTGPQGDAGAAGGTGPQGAAGGTGPQGATGSAGGTGAQGPQGTAGTNGSDGAPGGTGPQGVAGSPGGTGPQGPTGSTGGTGPQGPAGSNGGTGPQGPAGSNGGTGPQGPAGATGPQGAPGSGGGTGPITTSEIHYGWPNPFQIIDDNAGAPRFYIESRYAAIYGGDGLRIDSGWPANESSNAILQFGTIPSPNHFENFTWMANGGTLSLHAGSIDVGVLSGPYMHITNSASGNPMKVGVGGMFCVADSDFAYNAENSYARMTMGYNTADNSQNVQIETDTAGGLVFMKGSDLLGGVMMTYASFNEGGIGAYAFDTWSDRRMKENIRNVTDSGCIIDGLHPRIFDWKTTGKKNDYGFIAQEMVLAFPAAVKVGSEGDLSDDPRERGRWSVDPSRLIPVLVAELKTLRARVTLLESR